MTRVTNFGRKRTYLEAGFVEEDSPDSETKVNDYDRKHVETAEPSMSSPQKVDSKPAKKQKKTKELALDTNAKSRRESAPVGPSGSSPSGDPEQEKRPRKRHRSKKGKGPLGFSQVKPKEDAAAPAKTLNGKANARSAPPGFWDKRKDGTRAPLEDQLRALARSRRGDPREDRRIKRIDDGTTCFACRERGHAARDCPKTSEMAMAESEILGDGDDVSVRKKGGKEKVAAVVGICYRCGSNSHNLSRCKKPMDNDSPLPFASCFVCSGKGHLAGSCPKNQNRGVYPNGGSCKICGDTTHLAKDCGVRRNEVAVKAAVGTGTGAGADEDDFMVLKRRAREVEKGEKHEEKRKTKTEKALVGLSKKKVVVF